MTLRSCSLNLSFDWLFISYFNDVRSVVSVGSVRSVYGLNSLNRPNGLNVRKHTKNLCTVKLARHLAWPVPGGRRGTCLPPPAGRAGAGRSEDISHCCRTGPT